MGEFRLHLLAFATRELEGFCVGERADVVTQVLIDVARDLSGDRRRASGLERAGRAIVLARPIGQNASLIDDAGMCELGSGDGSLMASAISSRVLCATGKTAWGAHLGLGLGTLRGLTPSPLAPPALKPVPLA